MKIAYFDCFSGVAGDMLLAALLEAVSLGTCYWLLVLVLVTLLPVPCTLFPVASFTAGGVWALSLRSSNQCGNHEIQSRVASESTSATIGAYSTCLVPTTAVEVAVRL